MTIVARVKNFLKRDDGVSAILFAVTAPVIIFSAGAAVDFGMSYYNQHKLQYAIDTAALSGNVAQGRSDSEITDLVKDVAVRNFENNYFAQLDRDDVIVDLTDESLVKVSASLKNNNIFLPLFSSTVTSEITVGAYSEVKKPMDGMEIVLVLDNSHSMGGGKINALKNAANIFVDTIMDDVPVGNEIKIGIVPYSVGINVGYYGDGRDINGNAYSGTGFVDTSDTRTYVPYGSPDLMSAGSPDRTKWNGCVLENNLASGVMNNSLWRKQQICYNGDGNLVRGSTVRLYNVSSAIKYLDAEFVPAPDRWLPCSQITTENDFINGTIPPWGDGASCYYDTTKNKVVRAWSFRATCYKADDIEFFSPATPLVPAQPAVPPEPWGSCKRDGVIVACSGKPARSEKPAKPSKISEYKYNPHASCNSTPLIPMQSSINVSESKANLQKTINDMTRYPTSWHRSTHTDIGMAWAYQILSPEAPFQEGAEFNNSRWLKSVVLMSDGVIDTSDDLYYPYAATGVRTGQSKAIFRDVCQKLKDKNVDIYTIQFGTEMDSDAGAAADFKNCASEPSKSFKPLTDDELVKVFKDIADNLGKSKLIK